MALLGTKTLLRCQARTWERGCHVLRPNPNAAVPSVRKSESATGMGGHGNTIIGEKCMSHNELSEPHMPSLSSFTHLSHCIVGDLPQDTGAVKTKKEELQASQGTSWKKAVWDLVSDNEEDVNMQKKGGSEQRQGKPESTVQRLPSSRGPMFSWKVP